MLTWMKIAGMAAYLTAAGMLATPMVEAKNDKDKDDKADESDEGGGSHGVPEVGADGAGAALAVVLGGVAVVLGNRRRRV